MTILEIVFIVIGVALLAGAFAAYFKNTEKVLFPALMGISGVFLCGAQTVNANITGIGEIKFAKTVADTAKSTTDALTANKRAIDELGTALTASQTAFAAYRTEVDARFAELNAKPVEFRGAADLEASNEKVKQRIQNIEQVNRAAALQSLQLKNLTDQIEFFK
ncbi:MAG: hypothetical protein AAF494_02140 [Pseudomonadota bacterium]